MKIQILALSLTLSILGGVTFATSPPRPNILFFYVDDMGWGAIGPNGQAERRAKNLPNVRTPNLDRLAAQGVNFTRGYGCTVCSPARSSLQTGFHQGHTFADRNDPNNAKKAIRKDDPAIGKSLRDVGYVTGYWGKWGYGGSKDLVDPVIENVQTLPTSQGYQHVLAELHHVRAHTFFQPTLWSAPALAGTVGGLQLVENSMANFAGDANWPEQPALQSHADYPKVAYCDDVYAFAALDFVRKQGQNYNQTGQPFHGLLAVQIPHAPFGEIATLPGWDQAYADDPHFGRLSKQSQQWASMVTRIDAHFGNILAALEDPNNDGDDSDSVADNTLVIFQSDNGGPGGDCLRELGSNGGLSGVKGKIQEGGIRVPLIMRWPARIHESSYLAAGSSSDAVIDVSDLLPTFCELAGAPIPVGIDGVSLAPMLFGEGEQRLRPFVIHEAGNGASIIQGRHKLVRSKRAGVKLFDLIADPEEADNIAAKVPALAKELEAELLRERVDEARGFANTYHRWTGQNGGLLTEPDNWTDYDYSNAGISYLSDDGGPRMSWVARIENLGDQAVSAKVDADIEFLGVEILGNSASGAAQKVVLAPNVRVTGRNEIRLGPYSEVTVRGGVLSSKRWVDVLPKATLRGGGRIEGTLYNRGRVQLDSMDDPAFRVQGDYRESSAASLTVAVSGEGGQTIGLEVQGAASLVGELVVAVPPAVQPRVGQRWVVLTAEKLSGRFGNSDHRVRGNDGTVFAIEYGENSVAIVVDGGTK